MDGVRSSVGSPVSALIPFMGAPLLLPNLLPKTLPSHERGGGGYNFNIWTLQGTHSVQRTQIFELKVSTSSFSGKKHSTQRSRCPWHLYLKHHTQMQIPWPYPETKGAASIRGWDHRVHSFLTSSPSDFRAHSIPEAARAAS